MPKVKQTSQKAASEMSSPDKENNSPNIGSPNVTFESRDPVPKAKKKRTLAQKSGLFFPVIKFQQKLRRTTHTKVRKGAAIYAAAVLEYLVAEILEVSGDVSVAHKKKRIIPRHESVVCIKVTTTSG